MRNNAMHRGRYIGMGAVAILFWLSTALAAADITIANAETDNPTLLYRGRPMLKVGPLPEVAVFAVEWGSKDFPHRQWLDWMQEHRLGYGRVYPESGHPGVPYDADKRVFPFEVVRWEAGRPIVDLARFSTAYWGNFARVVQECADRGIVLQIQLYQRCFFQMKDPFGLGNWETNYFHPRNNVNGFPVPETAQGGYGLWQAMAEHPQWRDVHRGWVQHILDAVGDNGNVMIDLMNEGAFKNSLTRDWIETTLDIIEEWEQRTGRDLLVGIDFDHFYKKNDPGLDYALSHPRMELLICEGSEGHVLRELVAGSRRPPQEEVALKYRRQYRKPMISTNSPGRAESGSFHDGYSVQEAADELRLYQWYSMMVKVQGVGVYAKTYPLDWDDDKVQQYARESQILMDFFDSLDDYTALKPQAARIVAGPGKHHATTASTKEAVVYLHTGEYGRRIAAGERLVVDDLPLATGKVSVALLHPATGASERREAIVRGGRLEIQLPASDEDLVVHVRFESSNP